MDKEELFVVGLGTSVATNVAWVAWPDHQAFKAQLYKLTSPEEPEKSPLAFLEHYHWGLASICVGRFASKYAPVFDGFGVGMVASELFGEHPFGIGKSQYEMTGNIIVGSILAGALLTLLAIK